MVPAVFLMLVLLIGFPSSIGDFTAFADDDDDDRKKDHDKEKDRDDKPKDKKENKNLKVSTEELKAYKKLKEKAEKAREKAEEHKEKLKEKYEREIKEIKEKVEKQKEKTEKQDEKLKEKYEKELEKFEEKVNRLDKDDEDDDYDDDYVREFDDDIELALSSLSATSTTLCHYPSGNPANAKTLTIGTPAARAHLAHGDKLEACGEDIELDLEERNYKLAKKQLKLEELRSKFEQKQIELIQKLNSKYDEILQKRTEKLLDKVESGEYYENFIKDQAPKREFVLIFDGLNADPIGQSDITEFSGTITLITSSSTDTRGTTQFKVKSCNLENELGYSFECEYGKARTISIGTGVKDGLVIIATFEGDSGKRTGLKLSISTDADIRTLVEEDDTVTFTVHGPQSKITHQWFLSGVGSMDVEAVIESTEDSNDT